MNVWLGYCLDGEVFVGLLTIGKLSVRKVSLGLDLSDCVHRNYVGSGYCPDINKGTALITLNAVSKSINLESYLKAWLNQTILSHGMCYIFVGSVAHTSEDCG